MLAATTGSNLRKPHYRHVPMAVALACKLEGLGHPITAYRHGIVVKSFGSIFVPGISFSHFSCLEWNNQLAQRGIIFHFSFGDSKLLSHQHNREFKQPIDRVHKTSWWAHINGVRQHIELGVLGQ